MEGGYMKLSRKELQGLCKRNKIAANQTNLAMSLSLSSLPFVEGLEDVLITDQTAVDSPAKTAIKQSAPRTSCRTSTRQKPICELPPQSTQISTRTRCGTRRGAAPVASVDLVSRKMDSQLKEAAEDERKGVETPAVVAVSCRRAGTSVRQACSTRRSTRLLEKQMMEMHLDHDDDDEEKVEGDLKVVSELVISDESVVIDQEMGVEGISQQKKPCDLQEKTVGDDEDTNILPKASPMGDSCEVNSSNVDLQEMSEVLVVEDKDTDESYTKIDSYGEKINILPKASLMCDNKDTDELYAKMEEDSEKCSENFGVEHESDAESFCNGPIKESFEETTKYEYASFDQHTVAQESNTAKDSIVNLNGEGYKLENDENVIEPVNKEETELEKGMTMAVITQIAEEKSIDTDEKTDQSMIIFEMEAENCLIKSDQIADNSDGKENIFSDGKKIETHNILDLNKENLMTEKMEKVIVANKDTSLRQLKKMLKQLKISDKNANNKEDNNMAKVGKTRPALQTLQSNCLVTNEREDRN